jgi:ribosome recycling factor
MTHKELIQDADGRMAKTVGVVKQDLTTLKAGRANPQILDRVMVDYYGSQVPVSQVGNVSAPEPRVLVVQVWENSMLKTVEKAIQQSDLGINPINDGKLIRLVVPELTQERRKELVKTVGKIVEEGRIAIRSIRRDTMDAMKKMEKKSEITEDDLRSGEKEIQKIHDKHIKAIEDLGAAKEKEIMEV